MVEKNEVFGFKKDLEDMKARLVEASDNFIVIPIVGMPGTGKTRFALMLFEDLSILNNSVRIWVPVLKWCDRNQKFISIIYQITKSMEDLTTKSEEMLKDTILTLLKDRKYFIILDDVWERKDWDSLRTAFPKNMNGSTVLVTTRHDNVVDSIWKSHNLEKLSDDDGWLLIKNNVFGTEGCNGTLEELGKKIATKCKGLPLALVVVAGILRKCITSTDWQRVADNPLLEINREDQNICDDDQNKLSRFFLNWDDQMRSLLSPCGKHTHSLFLSSPQKSEVPLARDELVVIPNIFPLLRVLNIESIKFNDDMLPKEVYRLYLLKYISISGNLSVLPKSFKNLVELETLVIKTTSRTLQIEGGIWNMEKLRHVRINTSAQLPFPLETNSKTNSGGKHIHTLSTISPASCRKEIFSKTPNLQKLGVRGNLSELLEEKDNICLFNNLRMLKCLVNLKLYGQYDKVLTVPMLDKFARRLKMLSFSSTLFEWKDMAILGSLEELEVLKLDDYAFKGENWELSNNVVFRRLQYLRIGRTNLVTWKLAAHNSFPALRGLVLRNCSSLERIPASFAKREGPMMATRDTLIEQAVSNAVNCLVEQVELWHLENGGLEWEIKNLISDIETFNARLEEAYENPTESVNVLIVKNFQTIVNEAWVAVENWRAMYIDHKDKTFIRKFLVPRCRREIESCESEIQSVRTKVNTIDHEYKKELETLYNYEKNAPLIFQKSTMYDRAIEAIEQEVNMLHQKILCEIKDMSQMTSQIKTFTEDLVKACKNPKANEHRILKVIVKKFGILVIETMNAVTNYFAQEKKHGNNALAKSLDKIAHCGKPNVYASEIQSIKEKVKRISEDHNKDLLHILEDYNKLRDMRLHKAENNIVGFIDDLKIIKSRIMEASKDFFVIPIVGNAGTGKTTFALKIFEDPEVRKIFTHCIWLHVSRGFHRKQKFIDILHQISKQTEDFSTVLEDVLEAKVKGLLEDERYLIVLDDVQTKEDWNSLKVSFPTNMKGSRVLVTTCSGNAIDSMWKFHSLGKLSNDDGWLLIKNNVFGTKE
nr:putative late blight resistance protein homolog R1B-8 [Ipomoea batatas]